MSYQQSPPNMPTQHVLTFHAVPCVYYYHSNFVSWNGLLNQALADLKDSALQDKCSE